MRRGWREEENKMRQSLKEEENETRNKKGRTKNECGRAGSIRKARHPSPAWHRGEVYPRTLYIDSTHSTEPSAGASTSWPFDRLRIGRCSGQLKAERTNDETNSKRDEYVLNHSGSNEARSLVTASFHPGSHSAARSKWKRQRVVSQSSKWYILQTTWLERRRKDLCASLPLTQGLVELSHLGMVPACCLGLVTVGDRRTHNGQEQGS